MQLKNGKDLLIRKIRKEDAAEAIQYINVVGGESDYLLRGANEFNITVEQEESYIESLENSPTSIMLVGIIEGKIICIGNISSSENKRIAHIGNIAMSVSKEFWGLGVGTHLMNALIDFAKNTGKLHTGIYPGRHYTICRQYAGSKL